MFFEYAILITMIEIHNLSLTGEELVLNFQKVRGIINETRIFTNNSEQIGS
jgi:hypothetical protein